MRTPFAMLIAAALFALPATAAAQGAESAATVDFEGIAAGAAPAGFSTGLTGGGGPVDWQIVEDETAPAGPNVLAELSGDPTNNRFSLAIYDPVSAADVEVAVSFRAVSGSVDQAAGLVARLQDEDNYYVTRANALEDNVRLYRVVDGRRQEIASYDGEVSADDWHELGLAIEGDRLTVTFDGTVVLTARDDTFGGPGRTGLWTKADSLTHFDAFAVADGGG